MVCRHDGSSSLAHLYTSHTMRRTLSTYNRGRLAVCLNSVVLMLFISHLPQLVNLQ